MLAGEALGNAHCLENDNHAKVVRKDLNAWAHSLAGASWQMSTGALRNTTTVLAVD